MLVNDQVLAPRAVQHFQLRWAARERGSAAAAAGGLAGWGGGTFCRQVEQTGSAHRLPRASQIRGVKADCGSGYCWLLPGCVVCPGFLSAELL